MLNPKAMSFVGALGLLVGSLQIVSGLRVDAVRAFDVFWTLFYVLVMAVNAKDWDA